MRSRKAAPEKGRTATVPSDSSIFELHRTSVHHRSSLPPVGPLLEDRAGYLADDEHRWFKDELIEDRNGINSGSGGRGAANPRSFPYSVKLQCWEKAEKLKGRDPDRWRRDPLGNIIFRKLVGCSGCLCHDYDHIVPYSKGGKSTLENCQVLQATANRSKGNKTEISRSDLMQKSVYCRVSGRDLDLLELSAYGNVRRAQESGGCNIQ